MVPEEISLDEYLRLQKPRNKYFARRTEVDGKWFDSKLEAERYRQLLILERCGKIKNLTLHPEFTLIVNHARICSYVADFSYIDLRTGEPVIEDTKSPATRKKRDYRIKRKLFRALYGREIVEIL